MSKENKPDYTSNDPEEVLSPCTMKNIAVKVQIDVSKDEGSVEVRLIGKQNELAAAVATAMDSDAAFAQANIIAVKM